MTTPKTPEEMNNVCSFCGVKMEIGQTYVVDPDGTPVHSACFMAREVTKEKKP